MSYVQGTDFLSLTAEVKELARSVISADFSDDEIKRYQYMRYSQIRTLTDKDDWDVNDREYGTLQLIETKLAASDILEHYGDVNSIPIWQAMRAAALADLTATVSNLETDTGGTTSNILVTDYKSWNLNSSVAPPNRLSAPITGGVESKGSREIDL
jgi:hypothetical protein